MLTSDNYLMISASPSPQGKQFSLVWRILQM